MLVGAVAAASAIGVWADTGRRAKSRYYYSAGVQEAAQGNEASAYEYFRRAYEADPTYPEAASAYGTRRLYVGVDTLQSDAELGRSLAMMRQYVDAYPDDLYESLYYGFVAGQLEQLDEAVRVLDRTYLHHPESSDVLLQLSDAYAKSGEFGKAVEAMGRYEAQEGMSAPVTTRKISYMLVDKDTVGAVREVTRLVASNPRDASYRILKGNVFDIIQMPDSALAYYKTAETFDPESGAAKLALAGYYQQHGDSVEYDNKMYEVLLVEDLDLDQKTDLMAQYLQSLINDKHETKRGDYLFSVLRNQYPHEPRVLDLAARYSAAKGDFKDAEEQISYALDLDPTNSAFWAQLMMYQSAGDNPASALATFERASKHITPDDNLKFYYASVAQLVKEYDIAADVYRCMIQDTDPSLPLDSAITIRDVRPDISLQDLDRLSRLFTTLGDVYNSADRQQQSWRAYENALELDPANAMAMNNYAYFLSLKGGDLDKALELSGKAISGADADNPTYLDTYAWINYLKGNFEEAEKVQMRALAAMKRDEYVSAEIYDHLGDILARRGNLPGALAAWKEAARIQEENKEQEEESYGKTQQKIKDATPKVSALVEAGAKEVTIDDLLGGDDKTTDGDNTAQPAEK